MLKQEWLPSGTQSRTHTLVCLCCLVYRLPLAAKYIGRSCAQALALCNSQAYVESSFHFIARSHKVTLQCINNKQTTSPLDVMQSHPLCRTRFGQYQASSAVLGWPGDGDCYIMHRMCSGCSPFIQKSVETLQKHRLFACITMMKHLSSIYMGLWG